MMKILLKLKVPSAVEVIQEMNNLAHVVILQTGIRFLARGGRAKPFAT